MKKYKLLAVLMAAIFLAVSLPTIPVEADTIGKIKLCPRLLSLLLRD